MPTKIEKRDVCRRLIERRAEALADVRRLGGTTVRYRLANFREDMSAEGFISTKATLMSKWATLKADGIIVETDGATWLDIPMLYLAAGRACPKKGTHTHIHTQTGEASE
jgi:hypothetical protein